MKFLKYNIDSQSFKNVGILNILNKYIDLIIFYDMPKRFFIIVYKVINFYRNNIHFHNTDTLIACNIDTPVILELNKLN